SEGWALCGSPRRPGLPPRLLPRQVRQCTSTTESVRCSTCGVARRPNVSSWSTVPELPVVPHTRSCTSLRDCDRRVQLLGAGRRNRCQAVARSILNRGAAIVENTLQGSGHFAGGALLECLRSRTAHQVVVVVQ